MTWTLQDFIFFSIGLQFNIPKNETGAWSIDVTRINGEASTKQKRDYALRRFNLTVNNDTNSLLLYVTEPLDLEDFYRYLRVSLDNVCPLMLIIVTSLVVLDFSRDKGDKERGSDTQKI